jgi:hypothetical protein
MNRQGPCLILKNLLVFQVAVAFATSAMADFPNPTLSRIYPAGGQRGTEFDIELSGESLEGCEEIRIAAHGVSFRHVEGLRFHVTIQPEVAVGIYDVQAFSAAGISSTRSFYVSRRQQLVETDPSESAVEEKAIELETVCAGSIGAPGDVDVYTFSAATGETVVIECWAERADSSLRATLELYDPGGKRIVVNRGFFGMDPVIAHKVIEEGRYTVRISDLVFAGGPNHFYRLDIHTGPRVVYTVPTVVQLGVTTTVDFFGWNLGKNGASRGTGSYSVASHKVLAVKSGTDLPVYRKASSIPIRGVAHYLPGLDTPVFIQTTRVPVVRAPSGINSPATALALKIPVDVSGTLDTLNQPSWYGIDVRRGEVIQLEVFAARAGSPVDLSVAILTGDGKRVLENFTDEVLNGGGLRFPMNHPDPGGRWTAPEDGRYLLAIRDVIGATQPDDRRVYRLCLRREEAPFEVVAIGRRSGPSSGIVRRGGREMLDLLVQRRNGFNGEILVRAADLPEGLDCPETWFGPGVTRVPLVISATDSAPEGHGSLQLLAETNIGGRGQSQTVLGGTMVRTGTPNGIGRITSDIPWSVGGASAVRLTGVIDRTRFAQGSIVEIQVFVDRAEGQPTSSVRLTGVGLPPMVANRLGEIAAGDKSNYMSLYLPPSLPTGHYTIAVEGITKVAQPDGTDSGKTKEIDVTIVTNSLSFEVYPCPYLVQVKLDAPRKIKRGEVIQLQYTAVRRNGFIGKIHTEIAAPGGVQGIRGRGVTFVGQTESGVIQIIANEDAPLGQQRGLRLEGLGTVEDEPVHLGSCFLELEIVE